MSVFIYKKHAEDMSSFSDDVSLVLFESQISRSNLIVYLYDFPYAISYIKYQEYQSDYSIWSYLIIYYLIILLWYKLIKKCKKFISLLVILIVVCANLEHCQGTKVVLFLQYMYLYLTHSHLHNMEGSSNFLRRVLNLC